MVRYDDFSLPIGYEIIKKDIEYCDIKTKQQRRKAAVNKNQHFRQLIQQACNNHVLFEWVLADNWFGSKANMEFIHDELQKSFIFGIKSNRTLALSENDAKNGRHQQVRTLELEEGVVYKAWLKLDFSHFIIPHE